jgi:uncharacterized phage protein gp47/JayE
LKVKQLTDERGVAMVLEVVLAAVVLVAVGYAGVQYYKNQSSAQTTGAVGALPGKPATKPNGTVDNATTALLNDANADSTGAASEDNIVPGTDSTSNTALNIGGSYNESSF